MNIAIPSLNRSAALSAAQFLDPYTPTAGAANSTLTLETFFSPEEHHQMIAKAAYLRAQRRGFEAGHELDDWLWAEHEVNSACGLLEPEPRWDFRSE